jgi:hypothetical protein
LEDDAIEGGGLELAQLVEQRRRRPREQAWPAQELTGPHGELLDFGSRATDLYDLDYRPTRRSARRFFGPLQASNAVVRRSWALRHEVHLGPVEVELGGELSQTL